MGNEFVGVVQVGKLSRDHDLVVIAVAHLLAQVSENEISSSVEGYESENNVADGSLHAYCYPHRAKRRLASKEHVHHETQTDLLQNGLVGFLGCSCGHLGQMTDKNGGGESVNENGRDEASSTTVWQAPRQLPSRKSDLQVDRQDRDRMKRRRNSDLEKRYFIIYLMEGDSSADFCEHRGLGHNMSGKSRLCRKQCSEFDRLSS